jgi:hypothetical protein
MNRTLRHVTIPDHHDRIGRLSEEGRASIREASVDMLKTTIKRLNRILLLADEEWVVWYELKDELIERGAWEEPGPSDQKPLWAK